MAILGIDPQKTEIKLSIDEKLQKELKNNVITQTITFVTAAFGVVAALAWNEAIKAWLESFIKTGNGAIALTIYALIVTIMSVIISMFLVWFKQKIQN